MPYRMHPKQFDSVIGFSSADRNAHFVSRVADWQQLWGVRNNDGWLVPVIEEKRLEYFPVWPHPEYAQKITDLHFPGYEATEISLDEFLSQWLPTFVNDNVKVAVFPNKEWVFWVMEPEDLAEILRHEASQYE